MDEAAAHSGFESTHTRPPIALASPRAMNSPSPVPPVGWPVAFGAVELPEDPFLLALRDAGALLVDDTHLDGIVLGRRRSPSRRWAST